MNVTWLFPLAVLGNGPSMSTTIFSIGLPSTAVMVLLKSSVVASVQRTDCISCTSLSQFSANLARRKQGGSSQMSSLHPFGHQYYSHGDAQTLPTTLSVALTAVAYISCPIRKGPTKE